MFTAGNEKEEINSFVHTHFIRVEMNVHFGHTCKLLKKLQ